MELLGLAIGVGTIAVIFSPFMFSMSCAIIADSKGHSAILWCLLGLVFGPFAWMTIIGMMPRRHDEQAMHRDTGHRRQYAPMPTGAATLRAER